MNKTRKKIEKKKKLNKKKRRENEKILLKENFRKIKCKTNKTETVKIKT